ncbi:hypothetical protein [Streptomyces swartbergensis]
MEGQPPLKTVTREKEAEQRQERRRLIRQLLLDRSPVLAGLTNLVVQHFS